jgi:YHS domain-containing protein
MPIRRIALGFTLLAAIAGAAQAVEPTFTDDLDQAIRGYDPVAYFTDGKPVEGKRDITFAWKGVTWRFVSEKNRDLFKAKPEAYAPQYGGYCAWAVSQGYTAKGDPKYWRIVDGKLYLNYDAKVQKDWEKDIPGHISKGDNNWPKVLGK